MVAAHGSGTGDFFAIDRRMWAKACRLGINPAVAYLVLARGTDKTNCFTKWSLQAIKTYTGMALTRADEAVKGLIRGKAMILGEGSSRERPLYVFLAPDGSPRPVDLTGEDVIWLPNSIVTGTPAGERPPLNRLRGAGDLRALRLFVDLYHAHNLRDDCGVSPQVISEQFERRLVTQYDLYNVYGFKARRRTHTWEGPLSVYKSEHEYDRDDVVQRSIDLLVHIGLLTFVPHLIEHSGRDAEVIHPYGTGADGEDPIEASVGEAAQSAAFAMCREEDIDRAINEGFGYFCPVPRSLPDAQLVGIGRLRYRPRTKLTAAWYANLQSSCAEHIATYRELARKFA